MAHDGWTIDELAHTTGVTVRNIRAYQSRGLLPPPEVRARTGYYSSDHRARLELIGELTAEGVKLDTIKRLFETTGGETEQVVRFIHSVRGLFGAEARAIISRVELAERFQTDDDNLLRKAERQGLLRKVADDQFEETSPSLVQAGQDLVELGIPLDKLLETTSGMRRHVDGIAHTYVRLFLDEVWKPFDASGRPDEGWEELHSTSVALRTIAGAALLAMLEQSVGERLDVTFGRDIARTVRTSRDT